MKHKDKMQDPADVFDRPRPKLPPQLRTRWTSSESTARRTKALVRLADNGMRRIKGFFFPDTPASTGWQYQPEAWENDQSHHSTASLPELTSIRRGAEFAVQKTPPIYADDLLEIYNPHDTDCPGSTLEDGSSSMNSGSTEIHGYRMWKSLADLPDTMHRDSVRDTTVCRHSR